MGFNENVAERLASASLYLLPLGLVIGLLAAMFVLRIFPVFSHRIIGCRMLSKIVIFAALSADCLLSQWQNCRC